MAHEQAAALEFPRFYYFYLHCLENWGYPIEKESQRSMQATDVDLTHGLTQYSWNASP